MFNLNKNAKYQRSNHLSLTLIPNYPAVSNYRYFWKCLCFQSFAIEHHNSALLSIVRGSPKKMTYTKPTIECFIECLSKTDKSQLLVKRDTCFSCLRASYVSPHKDNVTPTQTRPHERSSCLGGQMLIPYTQPRIDRLYPHAGKQNHAQGCISPIPSIRLINCAILL